MRDGKKIELTWLFGCGRKGENKVQDACPVSGGGSMEMATFERAPKRHRFEEEDDLPFGYLESEEPVGD